MGESLMFKVIHTNKDQNVGIVSGAENLKSIGGFSPKLLKEWLSEINDMFGDDTESVELKVRKSDSCECWALYASHDGGDPMVMVGGRNKIDGSKWEGELG
jgi:hypothetical protein